MATLPAVATGQPESNKVAEALEEPATTALLDEAAALVTADETEATKTTTTATSADPFEAATTR